MDKLILVPDADGYNSLDGESTIGIMLEGGGGRYRKDKSGSSKTVNVRWTMNPGQYAYWRAFYMTVLDEGALWFLCDLLSEDGTGAVEHTCHFVPGSVTLPLQQGMTYVQQATLEVRPLPRDAEYDYALVALYNESGGDPEALIVALAHLVTVTMPEYLV